MADKGFEQNLYDRICGLLKTGSLRQAFTVLIEKCKSTQELYAIGEEAEDIRNDYERMVSFFVKGTVDPHREDLLDDLTDRMWQLTERLYDAAHPQQGRPEVKVSDALSSLIEAPKDDSKLNMAFEAVAQCRHLSHDERKALQSTMLDEQLPEYVRATLLSAELLHLLHSFDARIVEDLYTFTLDDQPTQIRVQAWVTLSLVALIYSHRIEHLPRLREQYKFMCESDADRIFEIQHTLLLCREAFSTSRQLEKMIASDDEQMPAPSTFKKEKIKEYYNLLSEGTDTAIVAFSQLKKIKFFSGPDTRHHWLQPFSLEEPLVKQILDDNPQSYNWAKMLWASVVQCDTDKYGAVFMMYTYSKNMMGMLGKKIEEAGLSFDHIAAPADLFVTRNYLHNLYRLCYMHPEAEKMRCNPFEMPLVMAGNPWLKAAVSTTERLRQTADLLYQKERWQEAAEAYRRLLEVEVSEMSLKRLYKALSADASIAGQAQEHACIEPLIRCNELYPGDKWTVGKLADYYHQHFPPTFEERLLREALTHIPDDVSTLYRMGRFLNQTERYQEALEYLFKADLQKEGQIRICRELAIALMMTGDAARAEQYIRHVLKHAKTTQDDWTVAGLIALRNHDYPLAIERFMKVKNTNSVSERIVTRRERLERAGFADTELDLIADLLRRRD